MQREKDQHIFFLFGSDFRGHKRRFKHFKLSNFSFGKNTVLVLGPLHFPVYDLSWFKEVLQLRLFCSANLQTINLWTCLSCTGAQHRKPETGVNSATLPDGMTTPRVRLSCLSSPSWRHLPSLQDVLTLQKHILETSEHMHKVQSQHRGWICGTEPSSFPRECCVHCLGRLFSH